MKLQFNPDCNLDLTKCIRHKATPRFLSSQFIFMKEMTAAL